MPLWLSLAVLAPGQLTLLVPYKAQKIQGNCVRVYLIISRRKMSGFAQSEPARFGDLKRASLGCHGSHPAVIGLE